ncbi:hypothetical protein Pla52n_59090 [Stieleria varia]|uniref:Uncharacterized protein n=1 Tax=Stieleria varia TaxID=2528005 RepID=A0A5C6A1Y8_9BACT|nr:hypothetical protein Pla52n_59090 [Stieleria varia]
MGPYISGGQITKPTIIFPTHAFDRIQAVGCLKKLSDRSDIGFLIVAGKLIRSDHTLIFLQHKRFRGVNAPTIPPTLRSSHCMPVEWEIQMHKLAILSERRACQSVPVPPEVASKTATAYNAKWSHWQIAVTPGNNQSTANKSGRTRAATAHKTSNNQPPSPDSP